MNFLSLLITQQDKKEQALSIQITIHTQEENVLPPNTQNKNYKTQFTEQHTIKLMQDFKETCKLEGHKVGLPVVPQLYYQ